MIAFVTAVFTLVVMCGLPAVAFAWNGDITKEETVYVVTDSTGTQEDVIVSDHLVNKSNVKTISDETTLSDIENVKGEETFKQKGDSLTWDAEGNSIYYQGKTDAEVPVTMDIVYRLNDRVVSGSELQGQSGKVEIRIHYENNAKYEGTTVPFVVMTGLIVTDDSFKNIKISKGKVIDDGEKLLVVGMAAPGLAQTLGIGESELGFGSTVTITGDADKFAVEDMMTIVTNAFFEDVDTDSVDLDYDDEIKALNDGSKKLEKGSKELYKGLNQLDEKMPALTEGIEQLDNGAIELRGSLKSRMKQLASVTGQMHDGSETILEGMKQIKTGLDTGDGTPDNPGAISALNQISTGLEEGAATAEGAAKMLSEQAKEMKVAADGAKQISDGVDQAVTGYKDSVSNVNKSVGDLDTAIEEYIDDEGRLDVNGLLDSARLTPEQKAQIGPLFEGYYNAANGANDLSGKEYQTIQSLQSGANSLSEGLSTAPAALQGAADQIGSAATEISGAADYVSKVEGGLKTISQNLGAYDKNAKKQTTLIGGMTVIDSGLEQMQHQINDSVSKSGTLTKALNSLVGGTGKLKKGADQMSDGVGQLNDGSKKLADGMSELYQKGIKKIVDMYNDDLKGTLDSVDSMLDAGKGYKTFTKLPSGMDGNVKFIYKTDMTN